MRRVVLITGATSGLGYEMAAALANSQYELILAYRNPEKGAATHRKLTEANPAASVRMLELDLSSIQSIDRFVGQVRSHYASIDVLCNNAGLYTDSHLKTAEGFELTLGVNYIGPYYLTRQLIPLLRKGCQPQILWTCSVVSLISKSYQDRDNILHKSSRGFPAYFASKQMELMMALHLAEVLKADGITVNAFHPGIVATNIWDGESRLMHLLGKWQDKWYLPAQEAAKAGLWLIESPAARTVTGHFFEKLGQEVHLGARFRDQKWLASLANRTDTAIRAFRPDFPAVSDPASQVAGSSQPDQAVQASPTVNSTIA